MQEKNLGGCPPLFQDFNEFEKKVDEYFVNCDESVIKTIYGQEGQILDTITKPYTVSGLALYLGCTRQTLDNYQDNKDTRFFYTIKKAKEKILESYQINGLVGIHTPSVNIFLQKAMFGLKETSVVENEHRGDGVSITFTKNESKHK